MKYSFLPCMILILFSSFTILHSQPYTAQEILDKSITYHDPHEQWDKFKGTLHVQGLDKSKNKRHLRMVTLNNAKGKFKMEQDDGVGLLLLSVDAKKCSASYEEIKPPTDPTYKKPTATCERSRLYRDYFSYLYGLPMKIKDNGANLSDEVQEAKFQDKDVYGLKVTYDPSIGDDIWYFYFDKNDFRMVGYRFYHDEAVNDGEYIVLEGEKTINKIRMPKDRYWYYNKDDGFLGADILVDKN